MKEREWYKLWQQKLLLIRYAVSCTRCKKRYNTGNLHVLVTLVNNIACILKKLFIKGHWHLLPFSHQEKLINEKTVIDAQEFM